jgi:hypothetical protein
MMPQDMYFTQEDKRLFGKLLSKVQKQSEQVCGTEQASVHQSIRVIAHHQGGMRGHALVPPEIDQDQRESPSLCVLDSNPSIFIHRLCADNSGLPLHLQADVKAAESVRAAELSALQPLVQKYHISSEDVDKLMAW